jgi:hypothetical protein
MYSLIQYVTLMQLRSTSFSMKLFVCALAAVCVSVVGLIALLPAYIESGRAGVLLNTLQNRMETLVPKSEDSKKEDPASGTNQERAKQLLTIAIENTTPSVRSQQVQHVRSRVLEHADVRLARVAVTQTDITTSGSAASRSALLALQETFRKDPRIAKVMLPVSELSGREGVFPFTLTITMRTDTAQSPAESKK